MNTDKNRNSDRRPQTAHQHNAPHLGHGEFKPHAPPATLNSQLSTAATDSTRKLPGVVVSHAARNAYLWAAQLERGRDLAEFTRRALDDKLRQCVREQAAAGKKIRPDVIAYLEQLKEG